jgi:predicted RNase H-like nuclease (RuvC/YqgF family)
MTTEPGYITIKTSQYDDMLVQADRYNREYKQLKHIVQTEYESEKLKEKDEEITGLRNEITRLNQQLLIARNNADMYKKQYYELLDMTATKPSFWKRFFIKNS